MIYNITNATKGAQLASSAKVASNFFSRLFGLMLKKNIGDEEALIFYQAPSIHTFFMRFPIDILFLGRQMKVKRIVYALRPWRLSVCRGADTTIELSSGKIRQTKVEVGDQIEITPQSKLY